MVKKNKQFIDLISPHVFAGVSMVRGHHVRTDFPVHSHDSYCIGIVERGSRILRIRGTTKVVPQGWVFALNPGVPHSCGSPDKDGHQYTVMCIEKNLIRQEISSALKTEVRDPCFVESVFYDQEVYSGIQGMWCGLVEHELTTNGYEYMESLLYLLIKKHVCLSQSRHSFCPTSTRMKEAINYIEEHYKLKLSLKQVASVAGLSTFHFGRVFKEEVGISPHAYHMQVRIKNAQKSLMSGVTIAETAMDVGFVDQSHFTRFFKRMVGITPGQFAETQRR